MAKSSDSAGIQYQGDLDREGRHDDGGGSRRAILCLSHIRVAKSEVGSVKVVSEVVTFSLAVLGWSRPLLDGVDGLVSIRCVGLSSATHLFVTVP